MRKTNYKKLFGLFIFGIALYLLGTIYWFKLESIQKQEILGSSTSIVIVNICGDNIRQSSEQCDGSDLGSQTCQTLGYAQGMLTCNSNCTFNTSQCANLINTPLPTNTIIVFPTNTPIPTNVFVTNIVTPTPIFTNNPNLPITSTYPSPTIVSNTLRPPNIIPTSSSGPNVTLDNLPETGGIGDISLVISCVFFVIGTLAIISAIILSKNLKNNSD
jgi:hypothetical protein